MTEHEPTQCTHWNDRVGTTALRPIRCVDKPGHAGRHHCGDTAWTTDLGFWHDPDEGDRAALTEERP